MLRHKVDKVEAGKKGKRKLQNPGYAECANKKGIGSVSADD